jgi:hypothetical protein
MNKSITSRTYEPTIRNGKRWNPPVTPYVPPNGITTINDGIDAFPTGPGAQLAVLVFAGDAEALANSVSSGSTGDSLYFYGPYQVEFDFDRSTIHVEAIPVNRLGNGAVGWDCRLP